MKNSLDENKVLRSKVLSLEKENQFLRSLCNKVLKKEIFWDITDFDPNKLIFTSDAFCLLDCVFHLLFLKSADDIYGFYVCCSYVQSEEPDFKMYLRCTFKLHHKFANPLSKVKIIIIINN